MMIYFLLYPACGAFCLRDYVEVLLATLSHFLREMGENNVNTGSLFGGKVEKLIHGWNCVPCAGRSQQRMRRVKLANLLIVSRALQ